MFELLLNALCQAPLHQNPHVQWMAAPRSHVFFLGEVVDLDLPPSERWRHLVTPMASQIRRWEWLIYGPTVLIIFYSTIPTFFVDLSDEWSRGEWK